MSISSPEEDATEPIEPIDLPTPEQILSYACRHGIDVSEEELDNTCTLVGDFIANTLEVKNFSRLDQSQFESSHVQRGLCRTPTSDEDPHNAVLRFCDVSGTDAGPLAGMRIGIKDKIAVAGVPMTSEGPHENPSTSIPKNDALVVRRLLDAGAHITAKTILGQSATGTRNPHNPLYSPGFSSSGSGAAIASGIVDAALGTDGGGSIRIPAAWCGIVGMKATRGLVPSFNRIPGDLGMPSEFIEIGPMTKSVMDNAVMLEVISGQPGSAQPDNGPYTSEARHDIKGLRIGVLKEALAPSGCTEEILQVFDDAQETLVELGAQLAPVSIPLWPHSLSAFIISGFLSLDLEQLNYKSQRVQILALEFFRDKGYTVDVGSAYNIIWELCSEVDKVLADVDIFITPTTVQGPCKLSRLAHHVGEEVQIASRNTNRLNTTGHPALTVPCRKPVNQLPMGLQIVGRKFDERTLYRVGFAFERAYS